MIVDDAGPYFAGEVPVDVDAEPGIEPGAESEADSDAEFRRQSPRRDPRRRRSVGSCGGTRCGRLPEVRLRRRRPGQLPRGGLQTGAGSAGCGVAVPQAAA